MTAHERFFPTDAGWVPINESFFPCPEGVCSHEYHYQAILHPDGTVTATSKGQTATLRLTAVGETAPLDQALERLLALRLVEHRPWRAGDADGVWQIMPLPERNRGPAPRSGRGPTSIRDILAELGRLPTAE